MAVSTDDPLIKDLTGWISISGDQFLFYCPHTFNGIYIAQIAAIYRALLVIQCHPNSTTFSLLTCSVLCGVSVLFTRPSSCWCCEELDPPPHGSEVGCVLMGTQPYGPAQQWHCLCSSKDAALHGELASDQAIDRGVYYCLCLSVVFASQVEWTCRQDRKLWHIYESWTVFLQGHREGGGSLHVAPNWLHSLDIQMLMWRASPCLSTLQYTI
jgi:hypothetical protein